MDTLARSFKLVAAEQQDRDRWVHAINQARATLNGLLADGSTRSRTSTMVDDVAAAFAAANEDPEVVRNWDCAQSNPAELDMIAAAIAHECGATFGEAEGGVVPLIDAADR